MANKKIGTGLIGYGGMGAWHIEILKNLFQNEFEIIGIFDIKEDRIKEAQRNELNTYSSREELLNDDRIDLVIVATPNDVHCEIVCDALNHKKNVVCEKPVAMNVAELQKMIDTANKNGKIFTVHQNRRWDPDYLTIKKIFKNDMLSDIFNIESRVHGSRGVPGDWRNHAEHGGGMVFDWGIHIIDQALNLFEDTKLKSIYAQTNMITTDDVDDEFKIEFKFENGINYHAEVGTNNFISLPRWYVQGKNGTAVIEDWGLNGKIVMVEDWENKDAVPIQAGVGLTKTMAPRTDDSIKEFPLPKLEGKDLPRESTFYANLANAINNGVPTIVTHSQQLRLMKVIEAVFESARDNKVIYFE